MNGVGGMSKNDLIKKFLDERKSASFSHRNQSGGGEIKRGPRLTEYPLSWAQQRLWFLEQVEDMGAVYHIKGVLRMRGVLDRGALQRAFDVILARHESLRTIFVKNNHGDPVQRIMQGVSFCLPYYDISSCGNEEREQSVIRLTEDTLNRPFDLTSDVLVRASLLKIAQEEYVLNLCMHHIASDGWSMGIMNRELAKLYEAFCQGSNSPLEELPVQYSDYAYWQSQLLKEGRLGRHLTYWKAHLDGAPALLKLPSDRPRPLAQSFAGDMLEFELSEQVAKGIKVLCRKFELTSFMVLEAAFSVLLWRISGQDDVVIGTVVANRQRKELEGIIGFFVNTLALRTRIDPQLTVADFFKQVKNHVLDAFGHQDAPFEQVVEMVRPERSAGYSPLFQVMLVLQNAPEGDLVLPGLKLSQDKFVHETSHFDLTLSLEETRAGMVGIVEFSTALFDRGTIERWMEHFKVLLNAMIEGDGCKLADLPLLTSLQRERIVRQFNDTVQCYPKDALIHELFEQQAERTPEAVAVQYEGLSLTYAQLNAKANQLARRLMSLRDASGKPMVGPDVRVAISVERSLEMVVGLLGILKAGAAYVPLDPEYPAERIEYMLENSQARVLLTQKRLRERIAGAMQATDGSIEDVVLLDEESTYAGQLEGNIGREQTGQTSSNLAYVIYTSGSTGRPKGVMIEHRQQDNLLPAIHRAYGLAASDCIMQFMSMSFDVAAQEVFSTLTAGARLVLRNEACIGDSMAFWQACREWGITVVHLPAAFWHRLAYDVPEQLPETLRLIALGGERPDSAALAHWFECQDERVMLFNEYGPTETTVTATIHEIRPTDMARAPIGRPLANVRVYVLDEWGQPTPLGVQGEIYIGGEGVARGYLNRQELTEERFVKDPFSEQPGARMYRTGDLGYWQADGVLQFAGRNDDQVKIRGFRIELGEIEAQLSQVPQLRKVAVVAREDRPGDKRLVTYWTAREEVPVAELPGAEQLRDLLKAELPAYMVPSAFIKLETMPLTPNGKVDRQALPAPDADALIAHVYEAPQGSVEEALASIWGELLDVERVGRQDNFFDLGGHSLLIVSMVEKLRQVGLKAEIRQIFGARDLAALAAGIAGQKLETREAPPNRIPSNCTDITPDMLPMVGLTQEEIDRIAEKVPGGMTGIQDIYPLAPLQEGVLFYHRFHEVNDPYVTSVLVSFPSWKKFEQFVLAINQVIARHDVLRTAILWDHLSLPVQVVHRSAALMTEPLDVPDCGGDLRKSAQSYIDGAKLRMDFSTPPLMNVRPVRAGGKIQDEQGVVYVILMLHHIIGDHVSLDVMMHEVAQIADGQQNLLPDAPAYRNFVAYSTDYKRVEESINFFSEMLGDVDEQTSPFGLKDIHGDGSGSSQEVIMLEEVLSNRIRYIVKRLGMNAATLFHVAYGAMLGKCASRSDVVFGSVLSGRMSGVKGVDRMVGMFINTLPVRLKLKNMTVREAMIETYKVLGELLRYEQTPLATVQRCCALANGLVPFSALLNFRHSQNSEDSFASTGMSVISAREHTNYPFDVSVDDMGSTFGITVEVAGNSVSPKRVATYYLEAISGLVEALDQEPDSNISALKIIPDHEFKRLVEEYNKTDVEFPDDMMIHELFEEQVRRSPDSIALWSEGASMTYQCLNRKANQLARRIRFISKKFSRTGVGVERDGLIGVCVERSFDMVVGLFAILKAGYGYVPVDPDYPSDRIKYIINDSGIEILLTQNRVRKRIPVLEEGVGSMLILDEDRNYDEMSADNLSRSSPLVDSSNLAYVMYTSGSTGRPKGVMNEHRGVVNRLCWKLDSIADDSSEIVLQKTSLGFDTSVTEIFWTLLNGHRLVLAKPGGQRDPMYLEQIINDYGVTMVDFVPSMMQAFLEGETSGRCASLRHVSCGGEELSLGLQKRFFEKFPGCVLYNLYGPTEAAVDATFWVCDRHQTEGRVPIGRPIANTKIYIIDEEGELVPEGIAGEICIGGRGVARGYLNRDDLTKERFVSDIFAGDIKSRMYRTGDLGRWNADGAIEYLGRNDFQVKIRGQRVELGEIETLLIEYPGVRDAVVVARDDVAGEVCLVAYWTRGDQVPGGIGADQESHRIDQGDLLKYLKTELPSYMVPVAFVEVESMPLTPSGKLDRKALPVPDFNMLIDDSSEDAPLGDIEISLAEIWADVLGLEGVGRNDNFFDLGGHSLLVIKVVRRMADIGFDITISDFFENPTIFRLAREIEIVDGADELSDCVVLMRKGTGVPLFLVHDAMGDSLPYVDLVGNLSGGYPVYGIESSSIDPSDSCLVSIENLASKYVDIIKGIQPNGAYRVAGWSTGGAIAYEIGRQLWVEGLEVDFIGLIDTYVISFYDFARVSASLFQYAVDTIGLMNPGVTECELEKLGKAVDVYHVYEAAVDMKLIPPGFGIDLFLNRIRVAKAISDAFTYYVPVGGPERVVLFLATEADEDMAENGVDVMSDHGWGAAGITPDIVEIGGTHKTIMDVPNRGILAREFDGYLVRPEQPVSPPDSQRLSPGTSLQKLQDLRS